MVTTLWAGLGVGAVYVLIALQADLVYTATGVFNFAQTGLLVITSLTASALLVGHGWSWWLVLPVLAVGAGLVSMAIEVVAVRSLEGRGGVASHGWLVTTLGAGITLQGIAFLIWGPDPRAVPFPFFGDAMTLLGGRVRPVQLSALILAICAALLIRVYFRRSLAGLATVATAIDAEAALLRGVNVRRVSLLAFGVSGAFTGVAALVIAPITLASFDMGDHILVFAFAALAIGGFGTQTGAVIGGLGIGLVQSYSGYFVGPDAGPLLILGLLLGVLLGRPGGLLASRALRTI